MLDQLYIVISFFFSGIIIGILFDLFRSTRRSFKIPNIIIYIEDTLFWILTGLIIILTIFICTDGQIRLYMILILITGAFIYFSLVSKFVIIINVKLLNLVQSIIHFITQPFKLILNFIKNNIKFKKISKKQWQKQEFML